MPEKKPPIEIQKRRISSSETSVEPERFVMPEKVIYIELDEEITQIVSRVSKLNFTRMALVVPRQALVLQSIINLKILKKKFDDVQKEILIVTTDSTGIRNARAVGFKAIEKLITLGKKKSATEGRPLLQGERPTRNKGDRVSISQVINTPHTSRIQALILAAKERWKKRKKESSTRIVFSAPNKQALFTLILISIFLLVAIAYIALPGATITITPRATLHDPSFNVNFLDFERNKSFFEGGGNNAINIPSYPVSPPPFNKKIVHNSTGKISTGGDARGVLTIFNLTGNPWDLAAKTRFATDTGLIFRTPKAIRVPPARGGQPGSIEIEVIADKFDSDNQIIGLRGNIGPTRFSLPGLKSEENRRNLYAQSTAPMIGGSTRAVKAVTKQDIEAAIEEMKTAVYKEAADELKRYLEGQNLVKKTNYSLLVDQNILKISEPVVTVSPDLEGKEVEQFEVNATYTLHSIAYDRQDLVNAMRDRLIARADPDKKVVKISDQDLSYKFLEEDAAAGKVRLTLTMRALQIYELDPESDTGKRFLKKITDHILGMRLEKAREYLQQQTNEIANVEINTWPIWAPTIPTIGDNIKFVIKDEEALQ